MSAPFRALLRFGVAAALVSCAARGVSAPTSSTAAEAPAGMNGEVAARAPVRRFVSPYSYEWFVRAELYAARGDDTRAVEAYRMALTSADEDPYVLARLAEALDRSGDAAGAEEALREGLDLDPDSEAIWLARARIAERHGTIAVALEAYARAEAAAPGAPDAPFGLAALLRRTGHPERADAVLARHAERTGSASAAGAALRDTSPRLQLDAALALGDANAAELLLATTPPDQLGGPVAVAEAYLAIDQPERALEQLAQQSEASEPDPHRRTLVQARALLQTGHAAEAAALAAGIPRASAHYAAAREALSLALHVSGLPALAREVEALSQPMPTAHE